jgi:hypothetical protein
MLRDLQGQVFPLASGMPNPAERVLARERGGAGNLMLSTMLYFVFLFTPGALAGLGVALGRHYGLSVYRFFVSWLFFWVTSLLTLDPFIVRYRAQLSDLIHHWQKVFSCTKTCLTVSFEHGFLYYAMLWSLSYAFVFVEAILALFWNLQPAIEITTFVFGTCLVVYLVIWIGRLVRQHSHLAFSNQPHQIQSQTQPSDPRFVQVSLSVADRCLSSAGSTNDSKGGVAPDALSVRLSQRPVLDLTPIIHLTPSARLDLTDHLVRNRQQMTIVGNMLTVEPLDRTSGGYNCYRALIWLLLISLGSFVLVLVLRSSFNLFDLDVWVQYLALLSFTGGLLLLVFLFGRKFADPTYLQFFMLLSTFFPTVYGAWLLTIYYDTTTTTTTTTDGGDNGKTPATTVMMLHLAMSGVYLFLMQLIVKHFSAPYLYVRFMMLPQTMCYLFQLAIFGFTPWSVQYLLVLLLSSAHNVLSSTGLYWDFWYFLRQRLCPTDPDASERERKRSADKRLFEALLATRYNMQLFAQDAIADVWSFVVVLSTLAVVYAFDVPVAEVMPSFTLQPIFLRLAALLVVRILSWLCGQLVFRYKLDRESNKNHLSQALPSVEEASKTLSQRLDEFLDDFQLSVFQTAELRTCYEEDMPELFALPSSPAGDQPATVDISKLTMREVMVMQIAERQWLLHPAILRKHLLYFHAIMYLLLFIVFQAASQTLPLRYAWFKPIQN